MLIKQSGIIGVPNLFLYYYILLQLKQWVNPRVKVNQGNRNYVPGIALKVNKLGDIHELGREVSNVMIMIIWQPKKLQ